ncbi:hypothetical protein [Halorubrum salsamenti]|uniref:hypothetical protein n=1 Tax=Halorubrum salsamenti TaxID=2583990 RepID=UPI0011A2421F|nr:hypothetical protein [Halorubrum salsamenti]
MLGYIPNAEEADRVLIALSDGFRRRLLFKLYAETDAGVASVSYTDIDHYRADRGRKQLYHIHPPKLEELGYIDWNESEKTVQKGPSWTKVEPVLNLIYTHMNELPPFLQETPSESDETNCEFRSY